MLDKLKKIDTFTRNIIIVFSSASLANFLNLLFQLLIAHKLSATEFAAFNTLLAIYMLISTPLGTFQLAIAKYASGFNAQNDSGKVSSLLSTIFKYSLILSIGTLIIFWISSGYILGLLKIPSVNLGYVFALLLATTWLVPVFLGGVQGLELFWWLSSASVISGLLKLVLAFIFIILGFSVSGAMGALLIAMLVCMAIAYIPLKKYFSWDCVKGQVDYKEIFIYMFPVAISYFCYSALTTFDMVLVRYFFSPFDSGSYALAQMLGKIFLFLPGAISIVMFPRTSGLSAKNHDTLPTLKKSLLYTLGLAVSACLTYNLFPGFVLMVLTGKASPESILLGRVFSVSMSFFALLLVLISYFLSIKDYRFVKYLTAFTALQVLGIILFHQSLIGVLAVICANSFLLCLAHLMLAFKKIK
jgi:O-antigen/teichoic acid export membrane protein